MPACIYQHTTCTVFFVETITVSIKESYKQKFAFIGSVKVWDPRQKNDPVATMEPGEGESKRDCWTVAFGRFNTSNTEIVTTLTENCCLSCKHFYNAISHMVMVSSCQMKC